MTYDPAVEAAETVLSSVKGFGEVGKVGEALVLASAREALAPIRDIHRPFDRRTMEFANKSDPYTIVCNHCLGPIMWPCATAARVYTDQEITDVLTA